MELGAAALVQEHGVEAPRVGRRFGVAPGSWLVVVLMGRALECSWAEFWRAPVAVVRKSGPSRAAVGGLARSRRRAGARLSVRLVPSWRSGAAESLCLVPRPS